MSKYKCFEEFIQLNYFEEIKYYFSDYLKEYIILNKNFYNDFFINSILVLSVDFCSNKINHVEFNVIFKAEYLLFKDEDIVVQKSCGEFYSIKMFGSFNDGFNIDYNSNVVHYNREPKNINSKLIPTIFGSKYEEYAERFLTELYAKALEMPCKININEILKSRNISVHFAPLEKHVFGKIFFANDKAFVYDKSLDFNVININVNPGTILINLDKHIELKEEVYRNTIVHELVHWFFHRNYFELRQLLDKSFTCSTCYKADIPYENDDIALMEHQARTLAPKILMPKKAFLSKLSEIKSDVFNNPQYVGFSNSRLLSIIVDKISSFFGVSKFSAKIRIAELSNLSLDGICNFVDGEQLEQFIYKENFLKRNQTFIINSNELSQLLESNAFVRDCLFTGKILYINKMLVVNNSKFINFEEYTLTEYALSHADECCFVFDVSKSNDNPIVMGYSLYRDSNTYGVQKKPNISQSLIMLEMADKSALHFEKHRKDLPTDFGATLKYHYTKAKENGLYNSFEALAFDCDITEKTIRNYISGASKPSRINVIKLCLTLKLSAPYIIDMLHKADETLSLNNIKNNILLTVIYGYQRKGIVKIYYDLERIGQSSILEMSDSWKENH